MKTLKRTLRKFPIRLLVVSLALALLVTFTTLIRPSAQDLTPTPVALTITAIPLTPTITPTPYREPGDTTGLMVLSGVLVVIIVIGVIMGQSLTQVKPRRKTYKKAKEKS